MLSDLPPITRCTSDPQQMARHRAALRSDLGPAAAPEPSALYPFVLAHPVADSTVRRMAEEGEEPSNVVHLSQEVRIQRLPRPEERIGIAIEILGVRPQMRGSTVAVRVALTGAQGEPVGELVSTVLLSGGPSSPFGEVPRAGAPTQSALGEAVTFSHRLTAEWIARYAAASGDRNPIHLDTAAARAAGFDTVIAHGMGVIGLVCEEIVDRFAEGSPARVRSLGARFSRPVEAEEPIDVTLQPDAGARVVGFSCRSARGLAVKGGWVELGPAHGAAGRDTDD